MAYPSLCSLNPLAPIFQRLPERLLDRPREAIDWLKKATAAPRYEAPHYPWVNLGRAYEKIGPWEEALRCYRKAIEIMPDYEEAKQRLKTLLARMN